MDKNITILLVDDHQAFRQMLRDMLRKMGLTTVVQAEDGDTALQRIRNHAIDLVLCDWNMPRMTGYDLLMAVREDDNLRNLPFIMITGEMDEGTVAEAIEGEVDAYLLKPFSADLLRDRLEQVMERKKNPPPIDIHLDLAQVYLKGRMFDQALDEIKKALAAAPKSARPMAAMGEIMEKQGDLEQAKAWYLKAIRLVPKFIRGHDALARVYRAQGQLDQAAKHLKAGVLISPKKVDRTLDLGKSLLEAGKFKEAKMAFGAAMKVAREQPAKVARQIGEAYLEAGQAEEAEYIFIEGLSSDPEDITLFNRLGIAYRRQGKFDEAVKTYQRALGVEPDNEGLHYNLGRAFYEMGDRDLSVKSMYEALRIYPEFDEARQFTTKVLNMPLPQH